LLVVIASACSWHGAPLTLLGFAWLAPILFLAPRARGLAYGLHAAALLCVIALHWLAFNNLDPLLRAWEHPERDFTLPILNLAALNGLLLCAAIVAAAWLLLSNSTDRQIAWAAVAVVLFAALT